MGDAPNQTERLKVGLVISGAISLGSFESGVICELTRAARAANGPITIDLVAGTSAGSITGAQVAKALLAAEPDFGHFEFWDEATLDKLTDRTDPEETSPLSQSWIQKKITEQLTQTKPPANGILDDTGAPYQVGDPPPKVRLVVTMTDLEGDTHGTSLGQGINVPVEGCWNSVNVTTDLTPNTTADQWKRLGDLVRASSAHAAAWEAVQIEVPADETRYNERWEPRTMYESLLARARISGVTPYFADGGTVASANLPVGKALRMMGRDDKWQAVPQVPYDPYRLVLYVEPDPETPQSHPGDYKKWLLTAKRAAGIYGSAAVPHGDLRWIGETNEQVVDDLRLLYEMSQFLVTALPAEKVPDLPADGQTLPFPFNTLSEKARNAAAALLNPSIFSWQSPDPNGGTGTTAAPNPPADPAVQRVYASVEAFYEWLDLHGNVAGAKTGEEALKTLETYLREAPLGTAPLYKGNLGTSYAGGFVAGEVIDAIRNVATLYYTFKFSGQPELVELMIGLHQWIAQHSPAGDRQWVCVTRISPGDEKPYSRVLGHFGGFLNQEWMRYDYSVGRRRAIAWLREKFPEHPYVKHQLRLLPPLPKVKIETIEPKLIARNAAPLTTIIEEVQKSAHEALPWLDHWSAKAISYVVSTYFTAATVYVTGKFSFMLSLWDWVKPLLERVHLYFGVDWVAVSTVLGLFGAWWWSRRPLERRIRFLIFLWGLVVWGKKIWDTSKEALWPSTTSTPPAAQVAAGKQTDSGK